MNCLVLRSCRLWALGAVLLACGCGKASPPPVTEVEGKVLLNGVPLANAEVQFVPDLSDFGAELNSSGVTDDQGSFRLTCNQQGQPGAVVAKHRVVVLEAPLPKELRGMSAEAQQKAIAYRAKLKNRPIPAVYANFSETPLRVDVTADKKTYVLELQRK